MKYHISLLICLIFYLTSCDDHDRNEPEILDYPCPEMKIGDLCVIDDDLSIRSCFQQCNTLFQKSNLDLFSSMDLLLKASFKQELQIIYRICIWTSFPFLDKCNSMSIELPYFFVPSKK